MVAQMICAKTHTQLLSENSEAKLEDSPSPSRNNVPQDATENSEEDRKRIRNRAYKRKWIEKIKANPIALQSLKARRSREFKGWAEKNSEHVKSKSKRWHLMRDRAKVKTSRKKHYENNKETIKAEQRKRYHRSKSDPEYRQRKLDSQKKYRLEHRDELNAKSRERKKYPEAKRRANEARQRSFQNNPEILLRHRLRCRMKHALRGTQKVAKTMELVGCSSLELRQHIEAGWKECMDWTNYGFGEGKWQVDHVRPLASFQLADADQQRMAFHFSNLSPEWFKEHSAKSSCWNGRRWTYRDHQPAKAPCVPSLESAFSPHEQTLP